MSKSITMTFESEKKHSTRFDYTGPDTKPLLSSIYVMKDHLSNPRVKAIRVTIEEVEE